MSCSPEVLEWLEQCYNEDKKVNIDCVIYNNANNGIYDDKTLDETIYFDGQKCGRNDHLIKANTTLYLEKYKGDEVWTYIGLITSVNIESRVPINKFKLKINRAHIHNGLVSGTRLYHFNGVKKGRGSCWTKRSSLEGLGFHGDGDVQPGIISVKYKKNV